MARGDVVSVVVSVRGSWWCESDEILYVVDGSLESLHFAQLFGGRRGGDRAQSGLGMWQILLELGEVVVDGANAFSFARISLRVGGNFEILAVVVISQLRVGSNVAVVEMFACLDSAGDDGRVLFGRGLESSRGGDGVELEFFATHQRWEGRRVRRLATRESLLGQTLVEADSARLEVVA